MSRLTDTNAALADSLHRVQSRFVLGASAPEVFGPLLDDILEVTESGYGFIAEVLTHADGHRYLRMYVLTDISWSEATKRIYDRHVSGAELVEFHNPNTLFGATMTSGKVVICNEPGHDPRGGGLPSGHPAMESFVGIPLHRNGQLVGVVGLSNRPGGYDHELLRVLEPLTGSCAAIVESFRLGRALKDSERRLDESFEQAAVGICHVSLDGRYLKANRKFCEFLGRSADEIATMRVRDVCLDLFEDTGDCVDTSTLLDGSATHHHADRRYRHASGEIVWGSVTASLVRTDSGAPAYFIRVIENITARKRLAQEQAEAEAARQANRAKTQFLSQVSHELRTPLNAVLGFAQVLELDKDEPLTPRQLERVQRISSAGNHLLAMIDDVLDLSRIESGNLHLQLEALSWESVVEQSLGMVEHLAHTSGIRLLRQARTSGRLAVQADRTRLRQVLVNLMSNAIKYNRPGGAVTLAWGAVGGRLSIDVTDTGIGMTAEQLEHLYEPFNRLGAEQTSVAGTGMGLVIARRMVELMGGTIQVASTPGVGTTFTLEFALADAKGAANDSVASNGLDEPVASSRKVVVYAEDNEFNVELLKAIFALREDCDLVCIENGAKTVAFGQTSRPDVFLLDMHLGDMTGLEVAQQLRRLPHLKGVPFVALSADAMESSAEIAYNEGFVDYLTKPVDVPKLFSCLDKAFEAAAKQSVCPVGLLPAPAPAGAAPVDMSEQGAAGSASRCPFHAAWAKQG